MKKDPQTLIANDIEKYFPFLFDRGYKIRSIHYFPKRFGNWHVLLESPNCLIEIYSDRSEILISFISIYGDIKDQIGLRPIIYFLSHEQNIVGNFEGNLFWGKKKQFERLANLLEEYIDQITPYFGDDFEKYKDELLFVQRKYNDRLIHDRSHK